MPKQKSLHDYDDRYRRVYEAGGLHWNDPHPNPHLADVLEGLTVPTTCIEFGCGEGYQARFMASLGHRVTAVDLSPAAVAKAKRETPPGYQVTYIAGDVTDLCACNLKGTAFDLAVDIGCLHMMVEDADRASYLRGVYSLLKPGGKLFLQEGLDVIRDKVQPRTEEEARQLDELKAIQGKPIDHPLPRTIMTANGAQEVILPTLSARVLSLDAYKQELIAHGFRIISAERVAGANASFEALILAEKPLRPLA